MRSGRWAGEERGARAREVEGGPQEELPRRCDGRGRGETWYLLRRPGGDVSWTPGAGLPRGEGLTRARGWERTELNPLTGLGDVGMEAGGGRGQECAGAWLCLLGEKTQDERPPQARACQEQFVPADCQRFQ